MLDLQLANTKYKQRDDASAEETLVQSTTWRGRHPSSHDSGGGPFPPTQDLKGSVVSASGVPIAAAVVR